MELSGLETASPLEKCRSSGGPAEARRARPSSGPCRGSANPVHAHADADRDNVNAARSEGPRAARRRGFVGGWSAFSGERRPAARRGAAARRRRSRSATGRSRHSARSSSPPASPLRASRPRAATWARSSPAPRWRARRRRCGRAPALRGARRRVGGPRPRRARARRCSRSRLMSRARRRRRRRRGRVFLRDVDPPWPRRRRMPATPGPRVGGACRARWCGARTLRASTARAGATTEGEARCVSSVAARAAACRGHTKRSPRAP